MKKSFIVESSFINSRLDRWIRRNICEIPQSFIVQYMKLINNYLLFILLCQLYL